jgi:Transglycosylase SLT domain
MLVDPSTSAVGSTVTGAIRQASAATGTSFNYLLATARVESGLNPQAGASTSSARGLFQFIDQTWLGTMKQSGAELGYGRYAAAISQTASGHYQVADPEMRKEILALRDDPTANATMAGAFTRANADILSKKLGRAPSEGELYIAHFLGAGGAARLISLASNDPNAKATQYFPNAATANSSIFFDRSTGTARTMAQVRNVLTARYDVASRGSAAYPVQTAQLTASATPAKVAAPDTAGITSAFAAATPAQTPESSSSAAVPAAATVKNQNQMFHGLFQDTDRAAPVAAIVSQLWTTPLVPGEDGSGQGSRQGGLRDLFSDTDQRS